MAKATLTEEIVRTETVTLVLSMDEAKAVAAILGSVGGSPTDTPRKHTQSALVALENAGVEWFGTQAGSTLGGSLSWGDSA